MKEDGDAQQCANFGHSQEATYGDTRRTQSGGGLLHEKKLSVKQAAGVMGIGATTLRRLINDGEIPVICFNGKMLLLERDIENYLQGHYGRMEAVDLTPKRAELPEALKHADVLVKVK